MKHRFCIKMIYKSGEVRTHHEAFTFCEVWQMAGLLYETLRASVASIEVTLAA